MVPRDPLCIKERLTVAELSDCFIIGFEIEFGDQGVADFCEHAFEVAFLSGGMGTMVSQTDSSSVVDAFMFT